MIQLIEPVLWFIFLWAVCWIGEDLLFGTRPPWAWRHDRGACGKDVCEACDD